MKRSRICPKCGGNDIEIDARLLDRDFIGSENLQAETYKKPHALLFKGTQKYELKACICTSCGFTEIYSNME